MSLRPLLLLMSMVATLLLASGMALAADSTKDSTTQEGTATQPINTPSKVTTQATKVKHDANCQGRSNITFGGFSGNNRFAQTFLVQHTGALTKAQAHVAKAKGSSGDYILEISKVDNSGIPTGEIIALQAVPNSKVSAGSNSTVTATFPSPAQVTSGERLALIVTRPGSNNLTVRGFSGDPCGGDLFFSEAQDGTFVEESSSDLLFATFVKPS
jgi:hypothetical protein